MTASVTYEGQLRTIARHLASGSELVTDAPIDNHGKGEKFSPTDLVATALGSCMLTVMGIAARQNDWPIEGTKLTVKKVMASGPRRISQVHLHIEVADRGLPAAARERLKDLAINCPVAKSIHPEIKQEIRFEFLQTA